jgi:hypothetical protein
MTTYRLQAEGGQVLLRGALPVYLVDYIRRYFKPHYQLVSVADSARGYSVTLCFEPGAVARHTQQRGDQLGRVPVSLTECGGCYRHRTRGSHLVFPESSPFVLEADADGIVIYAEGPGLRVFEELVLRLDVSLIGERVRAMSGVPIHGAVVAVNGRGVLIAGGKGAGKTSLSLKLAQLPGALWVSNDLALAALDNGKLVLFGCPIPMRLGAGTLRSHAGLVTGLDPVLAGQTLLSAADWAEREEDKLTVCPATVLDILGIESANRVDLSLVVWPEIGDGDRETLVEPLGGEARSHHTSQLDFLCLMDPHWMTWASMAFNGFLPIDDAMLNVMDRLGDGVAHFRVYCGQDFDRAADAVLDAVTRLI